MIEIAHGHGVEHAYRTSHEEAHGHRYVTAADLDEHQQRPGLFGEKTAARDIPCEDCGGTGRESYGERSWDCRHCGGGGTFRAADAWKKPTLPKEQTEALDDPGYSRHRKALDLAKNPVPGTHVWRGEVRHKDDIADPASVGLHWSVKPEQAILGNGNGSPEEQGYTKDHRHVLWQGTVDHPGEQTIPRSHPIWRGRHQSMDSEAEVRFTPGARVHLNGAYVWDAEGQAKGTPIPRNPDRTQAGWSFHPLDHHVTVEHNRPTGSGMMEYQKHYPDLFRHGRTAVRMVDPEEYADPSVDDHHWTRHDFAGPVSRTAKAWMPTKRLFGPTHGLDHRLFEGDHLKPDVRNYILGTLGGFWRPLYGSDWQRWAKVYFAGSEASEWTSETLEGNNDFDVLLGVDYDRLRSSVPVFRGRSNEEITSELNEQLRTGLVPHTDPAWITIDGQQTGPWSNTFYVNKDSYDIRAIRPYAAYDVGADQWIVRPPHLPDWDVSKFPEGKGLSQEIKGVIQMARGILRMPEPYRTQQGSQLWHYIHDSRTNAFGPTGEGWWDANNVLEKALDQAGLLQGLWNAMDRARTDPSTLNAPTGWSNDPGD